MFEGICEGGRGENHRFCKGFRTFGFFPKLGGVTCSQNKRDTVLFKSRNRSAEGRNIIYDFAGNCKDFLKVGYRLALKAGYSLAGEARDDRERFKARISEAARTRDLLVRLARQTIGCAPQSNSFSYIAGGPDLPAADCRPSGRGSRGGQYP